MTTTQPREYPHHHPQPGRLPSACWCVHAPVTDRPRRVHSALSYTLPRVAGMAVTR